MGNSRLSIVIGSGGVLCAASLGFMKALRREGLTPGLAVGCSGGSIYASIIALGVDPVEAERLTLQLFTSDVFEGYTSNLKSALTGETRFTETSSLIDDSVMYERLKSVFGEKTFADTVFPLHIVATDLYTGERVVIAVQGGRIRVCGPLDCFTESADEAAHLAFETLHDHFQVAHPALLDCVDLFGPGEVAEPSPLADRQPGPAVPVLGRAESTAQLHEWMVAAFNQGRDEPIRVARNGEVRWATRGRNTVVVDVRNRARIELHTILAEEVSFTKAHRLIDQLSAKWFGLRFFLQQDRLVMSQTLIADPFVPDHLLEALANFLRDTDGFSWVQSAVLSRRAKVRHDELAEARYAAAKIKGERDAARREARAAQREIVDLRRRLNDPSRRPETGARRRPSDAA